MSDTPFSTDDGKDGGGYDNILDIIVNRERDREREVRTTVRLAKWQKSAVNMWRGEVNTNNVEVFLALYIEGVQNLRENDIVDKSNHVLSLRNEFQSYVANKMDWFDEFENYINRIDDISIEVEEDYNQLEDEPTHVSMPDSFLSEVSRFYQDDLFVAKSIHRIVLSVGMLSMEELPEAYERRAEKQMDYLNEATDRSIERIEKYIADVVVMIYGSFLINSCDESDYEWMKGLVEMMETEHAKKISGIVHKIDSEDR
jgi:hypothetical protein